MQFTLHATVRSAQRSVPLEIVEAIYWYGHEEQAPGKTTRLSLDPDAIHLAAEDFPHLRGKLERYRSAYLVLGDDQRIITVARRSRRLFH